MRHKVITVAVLAATAGLTSACGTAALPAASTTSTARPAAATVPAPRSSCKQQYSAWNTRNHPYARDTVTRLIRLHRQVPESLRSMARRMKVETATL